MNTLSGTFQTSYCSKSSRSLTSISTLARSRFLMITKMDWSCLPNTRTKKGNYPWNSTCWIMTCLYSTSIRKWRLNPLFGSRKEATGIHLEACMNYITKTNAEIVFFYIWYHFWVALQSEQIKDSQWCYFYLSWIFSWPIMLVFCAKPLLQNRQTNGFSPVWSLSWSCKWVCCFKASPQVVQLKGFSPECILSSYI